jgi:Htaa
MSIRTAVPAAGRSRVALGVMAAVLALVLALVVAPAQADAAKKAKCLKFQGGETTLALDPATAALLDSAGIRPSPVPPATANADGSLSFPITGGRVNAKNLAGKIKHDGGIRLASSAVQVELTKFTIDTRAAELTALVGGNRVAILSLDLGGAKVNVNEKRGKLRVKNVAAKLTADAAAALNGAFSTTAFTEGALLGNATVNAKVKVKVC